MDGTVLAVGQLIDSSEIEETNEVTVSLVSVSVDDENLVGVDLDTVTLISESTIVLGWVLKMKNSLWISLSDVLVVGSLDVAVGELLSARGSIELTTVGTVDVLNPD